MNHRLCLIALLFVACGKEDAPPAPTAKAPVAAAKKTGPEKKLPPVPQGKLPKMDPDKAKFIAIPSTPKDPEVKKQAKPAPETKKAAVPATETKKAAAATKPASQPTPEVKKAAPAPAQ